MSIQSNSDLLMVLRRNLKRMEERDARNLTPADLELKRLLLGRIAIIEAAVEWSNGFAQKQSSADQRMESSRLPDDHIQQAGFMT